MNSRMWIVCAGAAAAMLGQHVIADGPAHDFGRFVV